MAYVYWSLGAAVCLAVWYAVDAALRRWSWRRSLRAISRELAEERRRESLSSAALITEYRRIVVPLETQRRLKGRG